MIKVLPCVTFNGKNDVSNKDVLITKINKIDNASPDEETALCGSSDLPFGPIGRG